MTTAPQREQNGWLLLALGAEERQHGGNLGYDDDIQGCYRYDSTVPNHAGLAVGDVVLIRSKLQLEGFARVERIESRPTTKVRLRCRNCNKTTLKPRATLPKFRCYECKAEFDEPLREDVRCTEFAAYYPASFARARTPLTLAQLREHCPRFNPNFAMQVIDLSTLAQDLRSDAGFVALLADSAAPSATGPSLAESTTRARASAQGFSGSYAQRHAIEEYAVRVASAYYDGRGYDVRDVGTTESFDLACRHRTRGTSLRVEVKGTSTLGEEVLVTRNEVALARAQVVPLDMFVVRDIEVVCIEGRWECSGGSYVIFSPWDPEACDLTPLTFRCALPADGGERGDVPRVLPEPPAKR